MLINERNERMEAVIQATRQMMTAARTAPKGKGVDIIEIITLTGDDKQELAEFMREEAERVGLKFFLRDANNVESSDAVVLIGTKVKAQSLNCGYCGYPDCATMQTNPDASCALNQVDLGIAIGSAVATAADLRLDSRVMFSAGISALRKGLMPDCHSVYAIPVSVSSKSPFFDRVSPQPPK